VLIDEMQLTLFHHLDKPSKLKHTVPLNSIILPAFFRNYVAASTLLASAGSGFRSISHRRAA
jgi:hypothetical protein